jgi:NAD(P)-dependent dehydrogenase (short-subunit alcohol dehydrogenase family)
MPDDLFSLEGRTALITGGSRGIGKMIAAGFIARGATVYISSRKATASELAASGRFCVSLPQDVSTVEGCKALAGKFIKHESKLDILINNAGAVCWPNSTRFPKPDGTRC